MKSFKPFTRSVLFSLLSFPFVVMVGCSGKDFKGNDKSALVEKKSNIKNSKETNESADTDVKKSEAKTNSNGTEDKKVIAEDKKVIVSDKKVITEDKIVDEKTSCDPGSADLTTYTSETNQETDLHIVSVLTPLPGRPPIEVIVKKRAKPVIIVLYSHPVYENSKYNWTKWHIKEEEGSNVKKIFVNSADSNTDSLSGVISSKRQSFQSHKPGMLQQSTLCPYANCWFLEYAWQYPSTDALQLISDAQKATGLSVKKFQGCQTSGKFIVN